jgi:hypothetical protein
LRRERVKTIVLVEVEHGVELISPAYDERGASLDAEWPRRELDRLTDLANRRGGTRT